MRKKYTKSCGNNKYNVILQTHNGKLCPYVYKFNYLKI